RRRQNGAKNGRTPRRYPQSCRTNRRRPGIQSRHRTHCGVLIGRSLSWRQKECGFLKRELPVRRIKYGKALCIAALFLFAGITCKPIAEILLSRAGMNSELTIFLSNGEKGYI